MSNASDLIEKWEQETGSRVDDNDGDNPAIWALMGTLAREMGQLHHQEKDDFAAGVLIRHQMTPEYEAQRKADEFLAAALRAGLSPGGIAKIAGK